LPPSSCFHDSLLPSWSSDDMNANLVWWGAIGLEGVALIRGASTGLLRKYALFYAYIGCIFATEFLRLCFYQFASSHYQDLYWNTELITIVASYGVILEIFRQSLRHNPGVARMAQTLLLVVFVVAFSYAATDLLHGGFVSLSRATAELGRDLRYVEGVLLLVMLWLFGRYRISLGPNLLGMVVGYSFWVGLNVINLAFLFLPGSEFSIALRNMLPVTFLATLMIWCGSLWSSQPDPTQPAASKLDRDYDLLAATTRGVLTRTTNRVVKIRTTRP
jgi:hypothetical protein